MRKIILLIPVLLLAACNLPRTTPTPLPAKASDTPVDQPCYFNWATQSLPELSAQVQAAMEAAGLKNIVAIAEAYGENCYGGQDNQPIRFATMETDFRVTVQVRDLQDRETLGSLLDQILVVLDGFPPGATPGPQPGYIGITFQSQDDAARLWFTVTDGEAARAQGLKGAALLDELQNR
jgi:hypothetical protein